MIKIKIFEKAGQFAENKDIARDIRLKNLVPSLEKGQNIVLDFKKVEGATQSFIHALISDLIRNYGNEVLDRIQFKSCNNTIQGIIMIVVDYMQESHG
ncbi:MAG: STAS-like domain-containing protein [Candidatus Peregrinibacteria bacterium]|nr:STAS-like domain-containing protein [Candidatus Peregrinibacteria bacterium]